MNRQKHAHLFEAAVNSLLVFLISIAKGNIGEVQFGFSEDAITSLDFENIFELKFVI